MQYILGVRVSVGHLQCKHGSEVLKDPVLYWGIVMKQYKIWEKIYNEESNTPTSYNTFCNLLISLILLQTALITMVINDQPMSKWVTSWNNCH